MYYTLTCSIVVIPLLYRLILELCPAASASFTAARYMSRRAETMLTDPPPPPPPVAFDCVGRGRLGCGCVRDGRLGDGWTVGSCGEGTSSSPSSAYI